MKELCDALCSDGIVGIRQKRIEIENRNASKLSSLTGPKGIVAA
jgi:hypothetical protein